MYNFSCQCYLLFRWWWCLYFSGFPLLNMLIWSLLRVIKPEESKPQPDTKLEIELKIDVSIDIILIEIQQHFQNWFTRRCCPVHSLQRLRAQTSMHTNYRSFFSSLSIHFFLFGLWWWVGTIQLQTTWDNNLTNKFLLLFMARNFLSWIILPQFSNGKE